MCEDDVLLLLLLLRGACRRHWLQVKNREEVCKATRLRPGTRDAMAVRIGKTPSDVGGRRLGRRG